MKPIQKDLCNQLTFDSKVFNDVIPTFSREINSDNNNNNNDFISIVLFRIRQAQLHRTIQI